MDLPSTIRREKNLSNKTMKEISGRYSNLKNAIKEANLYQYGHDVQFYIEPILLNKKEVNLLTTECSELKELIMGIEKNFFRNNQDEYLRQLGYNQGEIDVLLSSNVNDEIWFARADLVKTKDGFKMLEFNIDSSVGGYEIGELNKLLIQHIDPSLNDLISIDPIDGIIRGFEDLFKKSNWEKGSKVIGIIDWYPDMLTYIDDHIKLKSILENCGFRVKVCDQENVENRDNDLYMDNTKIDILFKFFLFSDTSEDTTALTKIMKSIKSRNTLMVNSLKTEVYSNKGNFAILRSKEYKQTRSIKERELIDKLIPWSSFLTPEKNGDYRGRSLPIIEIAKEHKDTMVLKPLRGYGGKGVKLGWTFSDVEWEHQLNSILSSDEPYLLQEKVESEVCLLPYVDDEKIKYKNTELNYGLLLYKDFYNGMVLRGAPSQTNSLSNVSQGASVGCVFIKNK